VQDINEFVGCRATLHATELMISSSIQPPINVLSIWLKVGINEIGRKSFSIKVGGCDLGNMTTFDIFQMRGTSPAGV